jgi:hypothetical protein
MRLSVGTGACAEATAHEMTNPQTARHPPSSAGQWLRSSRLDAEISVLYNLAMDRKTIEVEVFSRDDPQWGVALRTFSIDAECDRILISTTDPEAICVWGVIGDEHVEATLLRTESGILLG